MQRPRELYKGLKWYPYDYVKSKFAELGDTFYGEKVEKRLEWIYLYYFIFRILEKKYMLCEIGHFSITWINHGMYVLPLLILSDCLHYMWAVHLN